MPFERKIRGEIGGNVNAALVIGAQNEPTKGLGKQQEQIALLMSM